MTSATGFIPEVKCKPRKPANGQRPSHRDGNEHKRVFDEDDSPKASHFLKAPVNKGSNKQPSAPNGKNSAEHGTQFRNAAGGTSVFPNVESRSIGLLGHGARYYIEALKRFKRARAWSALVMAVPVFLTACATPARMHSETELNSVASQCGLALGQVAQDEEEKRLLFVIEHAPSAPQQACVQKWARRNGLRPVFIEGVEFAQ